MSGSPGAPLSALHAHALVGFTRDYEASEGVPPLPLWSNLLRFVDDGGVRLGDGPRRARLSRRAMGPLITSGESRGLLVVDKSGAGRSPTARLTEPGASARQRARRALRRTEAAWQERFGDHVTKLRGGLETLVGQLDLELPHYPMGYGTVDSSITGGRSRPARPGPPPIPAHGQDWRAIVRDGPGTAAGLPLSALLSQAVVAFAIDYESEAGVSLATAAVLQVIGDEGVPVASLPPPWTWHGHGHVTVDGPAKGRRQLVHLTELGKALRDEYVPLTADVESRWRRRFGADLIRSLRSSSQAITRALGARLPHCPVVSLIAGLVVVAPAPRR